MKPALLRLLLPLLLLAAAPAAAPAAPAPDPKPPVRLNRATGLLDLPAAALSLSDPALGGTLPAARLPAGAAALSPTTVKATSYAAAPGDLVPVDASAGSVPVTLPAAPPDQSRVGVKLIAIAGANTCTVSCAGGAHLNTTTGATSATLALLREFAVYQYSAAANLWYVDSAAPLSALDARYLPSASATASGTFTVSNAGSGGGLDLLQTATGYRHKVRGAYLGYTDRTITLPDADGTVALSNDPRFPVYVSGLRKSSGAGATDTAAVAGTDYLAPTGSGAGLTGLNGSQITTGTVADARLSANVALLGAANTFSAANALGTPASLTLTNATGLPWGTGVTGKPAIPAIPATSAVLVGDGAGNAAVAPQTGTGAVVRATSPALVTPSLGAASASSVSTSDIAGVNIGGAGQFTFTAANAPVYFGSYQNPYGDLFGFSKAGAILMSLSYSSGNASFASGLSAAGAVSIGGGAAVLKSLSATATLDFPSTAAQTSSELTITLTGATDGDDVIVSPPGAANNAGSCYTARVSAANTVAVRFNNYSAAAIDPAAGTFRVSIFRF